METLLICAAFFWVLSGLLAFFKIVSDSEAGWLSYLFILLPFCLLLGPVMLFAVSGSDIV
jgi:hypothetical protein